MVGTACGPRRLQRFQSDAGGVRSVESSTEAAETR